MKDSTKATKVSDIQRSWHLIDAKEKKLGRLSSEIAQVLMGKKKPYFVRHLDCGDYVVITNAKYVEVSGKKEEQKKYYRYSGYPGGLTTEALQDLRKRKPEEIVYHAVKGMLPQNRLRDKMLARLYIFTEEEHRFKDKFVKK